MVACSPVVLHSPVKVRYRRITSDAPDASGEAGSEQGWSVVGPPRENAQTKSPPTRHCNEQTKKAQTLSWGLVSCRTRRLMERETVPSQQQQYHSKPIV